jgi:acyl carrier protein
MNPSEIDTGLREVFGAVLGSEAGERPARADGPAWDSLKHMQIVFAVEEKFGIQFTEAEIPRLDSYQQFAEHLRSRHAA